MYTEYLPTLSKINEGKADRRVVSSLLSPIAKRITSRVGSTKLRYFVKECLKYGAPLYRLSDKSLIYLAKEIDYLMKSSATLTMQLNHTAVPSSVEEAKAAIARDRAIKADSTNLRVWLNEGLAQLQRYGSSHLKQIVKGESDFKAMMLIEGGIQGGRFFSLPEAKKSHSFYGPYQIGESAWKDGIVFHPAHAPHARRFSHSTWYICNSLAAGCAGDPVACSEIVIGWWNACIRYARHFMNPADVDRLVRDGYGLGLLYLGHNLGNSAYSMNPLVNRTSLISLIGSNFTKQSGDARRIAREVYKAAYGWDISKFLSLGNPTGSWKSVIRV